MGFSVFGLVVPHPAASSAVGVELSLYVVSDRARALSLGAKPRRIAVTIWELVVANPVIFLLGRVLHAPGPFVESVDDDGVVLSVGQVE